MSAHLEEGLAGVQLPPACRVGLAGWQPERITPTRDPVDCGRCKRIKNTEAMLAGDIIGGTQLALVE